MALKRGRSSLAIAGGARMSGLTGALLPDRTAAAGLLGMIVVIQVSDTGGGISRENLSKIFEPYFTTKKKGEGTGFGLSIVHGIVQKHRGSISVVSEEGKGTRFTLYFPLLSDPAVQKERAVDQSAPSAGQGNVLFVDDDDSIFESDIDKLATAGVTRGCNPPVNDRFCPTSNVTRGQMAAFLHRALG